MTATLIAYATSHGTTEWQALDWQAITRTVRRLQARIVQAIQARRWGKVKALQPLLPHSFSAKALAIRRVTENPGKRNRVWTGSSGPPRRRKRRRFPLSDSGAIGPNRCGGCSSQSPMARCALWAFRPCGIERGRRSTCWRSTRLPKPPEIRTHTGSGLNAARLMRSNNVV